MQAGPGIETLPMNRALLMPGLSGDSFLARTKIVRNVSPIELDLVFFFDSITMSIQ
jgi:hypothetical protein